MSAAEINTVTKTAYFVVYATAHDEHIQMRFEDEDDATDAYRALKASDPDLVVETRRRVEIKTTISEKWEID